MRKRDKESDRESGSVRDLRDEKQKKSLFGRRRGLFFLSTAVLAMFVSLGSGLSSSLLSLLASPNEENSVETSSMQQTAALHITQSFNAPISEVDCSKTPRDTDPFIQVYNYSRHRFSAAVDLPWWSRSRGNAEIEETSYYFDLLFNETLPEELYIDVGANVGGMAMPGLVSNRVTYAFDPLEFDVMKMCAGVEANVAMGFAASSGNLHIFRSLVGKQTLPSVNISRPEDSFGKFEQASLFDGNIGNVRKPKLVTEQVPMVSLDDMIPPGVPIGMVKIDVQGFEPNVVEGMRGLLSRTTGYPHIVHYEEQRKTRVPAGFQMGTVQKLLESYAYSCQQSDRNNITCRRPRRKQ